MYYINFSLLERFKYNYVHLRNMVELISRISKGTKMDQIYIPKKRIDFTVGSYVAIRLLETTAEEEIKPFFYNIKHLEPIKTKIIKEIFKNLSQMIKCDNIIITGSFLEEGFRFNDIDVILVSEEKIDTKQLVDLLGSRIGPKFHLILISNKALIKGLSTDPLYMLMLSKCVAKTRFVYGVKPKINYKLLDLHFLKSKLLTDNFDFLTGDEKYEMTRNLAAINQFISKKEVTKDKIDSAINNFFGNKTVQKLRNNLLLTKDFLKKYEKVYNDIQNKILKGIKDESKQK